MAPRTAVDHLSRVLQADPDVAQPAQATLSRLQAGEGSVSRKAGEMTTTAPPVQDPVHLLIRRLKAAMVAEKPRFAMIIDDLFDIPGVAVALREFGRECKGRQE